MWGDAESTGHKPLEGKELVRRCSQAEMSWDAEGAAHVLANIPFIQGLEMQDEGLIARLSKAAKFETGVAGTVIFRQGDPGRNCYIVLKGKVGVHMFKALDKEATYTRGSVVHAPTPRLRFEADHFPTFADACEAERQVIYSCKDVHDARVEGEAQVHFRYQTAEGFSTFTAHSVFGDEIGNLGTGGLFGELALMNNAPRATTIKCIEDSTFLVIAKEDYQELRNDLLHASETQVIEDFCGVLVEKCGSVVKAWRSVLDPNAVRELLFSEFVEALTSLQWQGNTSSLWGALVRRAHSNNRDVVVGLREISPDDDHAIQQVMSWILKKFDGAIEMFKKLTGNIPNASVSHDGFLSACESYKVKSHLKLVWEFVDPDGAQAISLKDMAYLEINGLKRKAAMEPSFVMALEAAKTSAQSQRKRTRLQQRSQNTALSDFLRKLKAASGGSFIRGFRTILDHNGNLCISKVEMLKGCRQVAFSGDVMALWKAMDQDGDGSVQLPDLDVRMALVLASFKKWCSEKHKSCVKAMQHFAAITRRRTAKWNLDDFVAAILLSGWHGVPHMHISTKQAASMLHEAADLTGTKSIVAQDVAFLDNWEPTPWLCAEPDYEGKELLISLLRNRYVNLIVAWRRLFDRNNKNHVTFKDFTHACIYLQMKNAPGVWRALDAEHVGHISLKNIDHESAQVLVNFKEWAEDTFGSIQFAFRVLDATHSNAVSLPVFKRMLSEFGFQGDARLLFQSLKPDAGGRQCSRDARLRLDDMKHLSSWESRSQAGAHDCDSDEEAPEPQTFEPKAKGGAEKIVSSRKGLVQEPSIGSGRTSTNYGSSRSYSSMSDFFHYCRVDKEHEIFTDVRDRHLLKHKQGLLKTTFCIDDSLRTDQANTSKGQFFLPPSPYGARVVATRSLNAARRSPSGAKRGKMSSSMSLPALGSTGPRGKTLPSLQEDDPSMHARAMEIPERPRLPLV